MATGKTAIVIFKNEVFEWKIKSYLFFLLPTRHQFRGNKLELIKLIPLKLIHNKEKI